MELKVHGDTIESLILERRETEREAAELQKQIDRLQSERNLISGEKDGKDPEALNALDEEIGKLTQEKKDRAHKLRNICRMARTISAGD